LSLVDSVKLFYTIGTYKLNPILNKFIYPKIFNYFFDSKIFKNLVIEKMKIIKKRGSHYNSIFLLVILGTPH
jgi:hypothetical protein